MKVCLSVSHRALILSVRGEPSCPNMWGVSVATEAVWLLRGERMCIFLAWLKCVFTGMLEVNLWAIKAVSHEESVWRTVPDVLSAQGSNSCADSRPWAGFHLRLFAYEFLAPFARNIWYSSVVWHLVFPFPHAWTHARTDTRMDLCGFSRLHQFTCPHMPTHAHARAFVSVHGSKF